MSTHDAFIPVAKPLLGDEEILAVARPLSSGWVTQGPEVAAFEQEFADFVGASYACAVSSCTTALHLALLAVGVRPGDEVITVSHSFIASANSIRYCGALPVFVDICPDTFNLDVGQLEHLISDRTRAILCVHQMGMPCDMNRILAIAARYGVAVVEDAACAVGSEIYTGECWERVGKPHGDIACFSFHPRKVITTGDGGMITTNHCEWDRQIRRLRHHGMSISDATRHSASEVVFETYPELGYNYRMTDIQAAIGREQLKRLPEIVARRRELVTRYKHLLAPVTSVGLPVEPDWAKSNWQSFCIRLPEDVDQRQIMQNMLDAGIATRRGIMCVHREAAYPSGTWSCGMRAATCSCLAGACKYLENSEVAQDKAIVLPLYFQMTFEQQDQVVITLRNALKTCK